MEMPCLAICNLQSQMALVWRKIGRDLWFHRTQTLLALVAIGISVWLLMTLMFSRTLLVNNLTLAASSSLRPAVVFQVTGLAADQVAALQALPGVFSAGGVRFDSFRLQFGDEIWYDLALQTRSDLHATGQSSLSLVTGNWPAPTTAGDPQPFSLALEDSARTVSAVHAGATVRLYRDDMGERSVPVAGMIYDPTARPSRFLSNTLHGFATLEGLSALTGRKSYDWLYLRFAPGLPANEQAAALARVEAWLHRAGIAYGRQPIAPDDLVLVRFSELALSVLTLLALLGCFLGAVWISSVMTTRMVRAQAEIGIMKAMGFQRSQIAALYMGQALCLGLIATLIALVASYASAQILSHTVADWLFAKQITERTIPPALWAAGLGMGLLLPLVATSYPIWRGTAITVRQALGRGPSSFDRRGQGWLAQIGRTGHDAPHLRYIGRNLLRHKGRLILSSATLSLAGMIFVTTSSLSASLDQGLVLMMNYWQADLRFETGIPLGAYLVRNEALALPGVAALEARLLQRNSVRQRPDGTTSPRSINLVGLPPTSPFLAPTLLAGRWLRDDDLNSVVIDSELLRMEPDLAVGAWVTLDVRGAARPWQIVGIVTSQLLGYSLTDSAVAYTRYQYLSEVSGYSGKANFFLVQTSEPGMAAQVDVGRRLEDQLHRYRFSPVVMEPQFTRLRTAEQIFSLLTMLVLAMSVLFALVGGLSLFNLMRLHVLERRHEIGSIRAMGGTRHTLTLLVTGEALLVSLVSAVLACLVAWPVSWLLCREVGMRLSYTPLPYHYSVIGVCSWLLISVVFAGLSSYLPLRQFVRSPVSALLARE